VILFDRRAVFGAFLGLFALALTPAIARTVTDSAGRSRNSRQDIASVRRGAAGFCASLTLNAEIAVTLSDDQTVYSLITNESLRELGLCVGREAIVLIKASFVVIAPGKYPPAVSVRNCLQGVVLRCQGSAVNAEVVLDIGGGKTLAATITAHSAEALGLSPGKPACALFDAAHVIIAID